MLILLHAYILSTSNQFQPTMFEQRDFYIDTILVRSSRVWSSTILCCYVIQNVYEKTKNIWREHVSNKKKQSLSKKLALAVAILGTIGGGTPVHAVSPAPTEDVGKIRFTTDLVNIILQDTTTTSGNVAYLENLALDRPHYNTAGFIYSNGKLPGYSNAGPDSPGYTYFATGGDRQRLISPVKAIVTKMSNEWNSRSYLVDVQGTTIAGSKINRMNDQMSFANDSVTGAAGHGTNNTLLLDDIMQVTVNEHAKAINTLTDLTYNIYKNGVPMPFVGINKNDGNGIATTSSTGNFDGSGASGNASIAIGINAKADQRESIALGVNAQAKSTNPDGGYATAIGANSVADGKHTTAIGDGTQALVSDSLAVGAAAKATADSSTAVGESALASATNASAFGQVASASAEEATAIGARTKATGKTSIAVGSLGTLSKGENSIAIGAGSKAVGSKSIAIVAGNNVTVATDTTAADGHTKYTVSAKNSTASAGSTAVSVVEGAEINGTTNYAVDLSAATKASLGKADSAIQSVAVEGANLTVTNANNIATLKFSDNPTFAGIVTAPTFSTGAGGPSLSNIGINAGSKVISNVANGVADKDAVNMSQLNAVDTKVTNNTTNITSLTNTVNAGTFTVSANAGAKDRIAKDENIDFANGTNTAVTYDAANNKFVYSVVDAPTFAGTVTSATGFTVTGGPSMTTAGIDAGSKKITNVDNGVADKDAVNMSQLNAAITSSGNAANLGITDGTNNSTVNLATQKLGIKGTTDEIVSTVAGQDVTLSLSDKAKASIAKADSAIQSVTSTDANLTATTDANKNVTLTLSKTPTFDKVTVGTVTIDKTTNKIDGLANATLSATSKEAVTGQQLHATNTNVTNNTTAINTLNNTVNAGTFTVSANAGTADRIAKDENIDFANGANTTVTYDAANNKFVYSVVAAPTFAGTVTAPTFVTSGTHAVTVSGTTGTITGLTNKTFDAASITSGQAATEDQLKSAIAASAAATSLGITDGTNNSTVNLATQKLGIKGTTDEIVSTVAGQDVTLSLSQSVKDKLATIGSGKDGRDGAAGAAGLTGPTGKDGLNGKDLTDKVNAIRNGEAGTLVYTNAAGERLAKGNDGNYYLASQVNSDGTVAAGVAPQTPVRLSAVDSTGATTGNGIKISNLADGEISATSKDAINGSQLHATNTNITNLTNTVNAGAFTVNANGGAKDRIAKDENIEFANGSNTAVTYDATNNKFVYSVVAAPTFAGKVTAPTFETSGTNAVKVSGETGTITGLTNTTFDAAKITSGQAATEDQLKVVDAKVAQNTTDITNIKGDITNIKGDITNIKGDITNIKGDVTNLQEADKFSVKYDKNDDGTINKDKVTFAGTAYDANNKTGGTKLSNVARGTDDADAVNYSQLKEVAATAAAHTTVGSTDTNIALTESTNAAGGKHYDLGLAKDIKVDSVTAGASKLNTNGLTITGGPSVLASGINAGNMKVTGVADGIVAADSNDAVNGSQLFKVKTQAEGNTVALGGGAKYDFNTNTYTAPTYNITNVATGTEVAARDVGTALDNLNQGVVHNNKQITNLYGKMGTMEQDVARAGAGAMAMAALHPMQYDPANKTQLMAGLGHYRSQNAIAIGVAHYDNEKLMYSMGATYEGSNVGVNFGLTWKLGRKKPIETVVGDTPETIMLKNRVIEMQLKMEAMEKKLEKLLESK